MKNKEVFLKPKNATELLDLLGKSIADVANGELELKAAATISNMAGKMISIAGLEFKNLQWNYSVTPGASTQTDFLTAPKNQKKLKA